MRTSERARAPRLGQGVLSGQVDPALSARQLQILTLGPGSQAERTGTGDQRRQHRVERVVGADARLPGALIPNEPRCLGLQRGEQRLAGQRLRLAGLAEAPLVAGALKAPKQQGGRRIDLENAVGAGAIEPGPRPPEARLAQASETAGSERDAVGGDAQRRQPATDLLQDGLAHEAIGAPVAKVGLFDLGPVSFARVGANGGDHAGGPAEGRVDPDPVGSREDVKQGRVVEIDERGADPGATAPPFDRGGGGALIGGGEVNPRGAHQRAPRALECRLAHRALTV